MQYLKCSEDRCKSNYSGHCVKNMINVSEEAYCHSYESKNEVNCDDAQKEYEFACDVGLAIEDDMHKIDCRCSHCNYNEMRACMLKGIKVERRKFGAVCSSYQRKRP